MDAGQETNRQSLDPTKGGAFCWRSSALWLLAVPVLGVSVAWLAVVAQSYFAPLVIFPLLVGIVLGAITVGLVRLSPMGNRPTVVLGTVLAAAVAVVGQHYLSYRTALSAHNRGIAKLQMAKKVFPDDVKVRIPEPPANLVEFMRRQAARGRPMIGQYVARGLTAWISWAADGMLVLVAALALVVPTMRQPYCSQCRSWYRLVRSGRLEPTTAGRLAEIAEVSEAGGVRSARYRLLACQGGCGPTAFELTWERSGGGSSTVQTWLDTTRRNRIIQVLDEAKGKGDA